MCVAFSSLKRDYFQEVRKNQPQSLLFSMHNVQHSIKITRHEKSPGTMTSKKKERQEGCTTTGNPDMVVSRLDSEIIMTHMSKGMKESVSKITKGIFFQLEIGIFREKEPNNQTDIPDMKNLEPSGKI